MLKIDLIIQQQFGRIGLDIKNSQYDLHIKKADLEVKQLPAEISLRQPQPNLTIDYTPFLESLGFSGIEHFMRTKKQEAQQDFYENLAQTISEGNALGAIEKDISFGEVADQATAPKERDLQIAPLSSIVVTFATSPFEWDAKEGGVEVEAQIGDIGIENFVFPSVQVYWEKEPYLKIKAVGQVIDCQK